MDTRSIPMVDLVDLCEKYGWRRCGPDHDLMGWLEDRLKEADALEGDDVETLRETADELRAAEERIEALEGAIRKQAEALRSEARALKDRSDELVSMAQQHEADADD